MRVMDRAEKRSPVEAADHLAAASIARASGDLDGMRAALVAAFDAARAVGDTEAMADAALAMPSGQRFGVYPGQIPALLHEAYNSVDDVATRCRLAAALARSWVYGGDAARAAALRRRRATSRRRSGHTGSGRGRARRRPRRPLGSGRLRRTGEPGRATRRRGCPLGRRRPASLRALVAAHHRVGMPRHRGSTTPAPGARRGRRGIRLGPRRVLRGFTTRDVRAGHRRRERRRPS